MNYSKWLLVTLSALAVAACGGDGDDNGSGGGGQVQNTQHQYHTLAYASTDLTSARTTTVPHFADSGQISLGGTNVAFSHVNDDLVINGYRYMVMGDDFTPDEGGMVLCQDNAPDSSIWHAILPAKATAVSGAHEQLAKLIEGQFFNYFEECNSTSEVFEFDENGVKVEGSTQPDDGASAEQLLAMLTTEGLTVAEDGGEGTTWLRVYENEGKVFAVIIEQWRDDGATEVEYDIMILTQAELQPV